MLQDDTEEALKSFIGNRVVQQHGRGGGGRGRMLFESVVVVVVARQKSGCGRRENEETEGNRA